MKFPMSGLKIPWPMVRESGPDRVAMGRLIWHGTPHVLACRIECIIRAHTYALTDILAHGSAAEIEFQGLCLPNQSGAPALFRIWRVAPRHVHLSFAFTGFARRLSRRIRAAWKSWYPTVARIPRLARNFRDSRSGTSGCAAAHATVTALRCAGRTPPGRRPGPAAYRTARRGRLDCSGRSPIPELRG